MFRREFKKNLKNKLMRDERELLNIENLIKVLIKIDDKLYKRTIKKAIRLISRKSKNFL